MLSKKIFAGGKLNRDDDFHLLPKNDWVDAKNIRINSTADGYLGAVSNIKGMEFMDSPTPIGDNDLIIGARGFDVVNKGYYFTCDPIGNRHRIIEFNATTNTFEVLVDNLIDTDNVNVLNFSPSYRINHIDLVDEKYLFWTDGLNPPRMLDITKNYGVITEKSLSVIKQPPLLPISNVQSIDDPAGFYNSLDDKAWQFKYRYVYWDNSKSAYSPASSIGNQRSRGNAAIKTFASKVFDSAIKFNFNGGGELVKGVEIIGRIGVANDWQLVTSFDFENQSYLPVYRLGISDLPSVAYSVTFTVNGTPTVISGTGDSSSNALNDLNNKFDASGLSSSISKEFYDNINGFGYMEFTPVDSDITLTITTSTASVVNLIQAQNLISNTNSSNLFTFTSSNNLSTVDQVEANAPFDYVPLLANSEANPNGNYLVYGDYTEGYDNVDVDFSVKTQRVFINKSQYEVAMSNGNTGSYQFTRFTFSGTFSNDISLVYQKAFASNDYSYFNSVSAFENETETDWLLRFGKVLDTSEGNDFVLPSTQRTVVVDTGAKTVELRIPNGSPIIFFESVVLSRNTNTWFKGGNKYNVGLVYIDEYGRFGAVNTVNGNTFNVSTIQTFTSTISSVQPEINIKSLAPSWASKYAIVVTKSMAIGKFLQMPIDDDYTFNTDGTITIKKRPISEYNDEFNGSIDMTFLPGDEVVLFNYPGSTFTTTLKEINDDGDFIIYGTGLSQQTFVRFGLRRMEIRQRIVGNDSLYYQVALIGDISPEGYHLVPEGTTGTNQSLGVNAEVLISNGDTAVRNVWMDSLPSVSRQSEWLELYSFSDYDPTLITPNVGTPNVVNPLEKQTRYPSSIRFGGAYVVGTSVNNIASFAQSSFKDFSLNYGPIQRLDIDGNRMIVGQRLRIGVAPVFESVLLDKQDTENVAISERLINDITYYGYEAGIGDAPESYARWGSKKYFTDKNRGLICRIAENGITPISITAKMNTFCRDILPSCSRIVGGYDPKNSEYNVSMIRSGTDYTLVFSENSDGFTSFMDYIPTYYMTINQELYSFELTGLYKHNASETYNNFYGAQYDSEFTIVDNESALQVKSYLSLSEVANDLWTSPSIETSLGQASNLIANDFKEPEGTFAVFEGGYFAGFLNDINSPDGIIEGDTLKGNWIKIKLLNSNTNFVYLLSVGVNQVPSLQGNI